MPRVGVEPTSDALQAPAVTTLAISARKQAYCICYGAILPQTIPFLSSELESTKKGGQKTSYTNLELITDQVMACDLHQIHASYLG